MRLLLFVISGSEGHNIRLATSQCVGDMSTKQQAVVFSTRAGGSNKRRVLEIQLRGLLTKRDVDQSKSARKGDKRWETGSQLWVEAN